MAFNTQQEPSFLQRAKKIVSTPEEKPSFLKKAKVISVPETQYISDEDVEKDIERQQARMTSRGLETIVGAPGDILSFAASLFGKEQNILPTSESLKKKSEELSQGYLSPKNKLEEFGDELVSDITSFALPGAKHYSIARNLGIPIVANLAKEGIKYASKNDKDAAYGKMGTMLILDLMSHRKGLGGGAKQFAGSLFRQAEEALPKGQSIKAIGLQKSLNNLKNTLEMGGDVPSTRDALKKISEINSEIKNGKIDVKNLAAYRPAINEIIESFGGFEMQLPKKIKQKAIFNLNQVKGQVIKDLNEYGKTLNPEFGKLHTAANEAWAAYENSNKIANFIQKHVGKSLKSTAAKSILATTTGGLAAKSALAAPAGTAALGTLGIGVAGAWEGFKVLNRMKNSPTLRKHYTNIITGALKGNTAQVSKNAKLLDKEFLKQESQDGSMQSSP